MSHPNSSWLHWVTYRLVVVLKVGELLTGSIVVITNIGIEEVALRISILISMNIRKWNVGGAELGWGYLPHASSLPP